MIKQILLSAGIFLAFTTQSQTKFESSSGIYSFTMPDTYKNEKSNHQRNEFVFVNKSDTTSLVVNVNDRILDKNSLRAFKAASNNDIEKNYFKVLQEPKIITRGDLAGNKDKTIFFHVRHQVSSTAENDLMLTYLFYNKGKEINFIFRTKEHRLDKVLPEINNIVNSVNLKDLANN